MRASRALFPHPRAVLTATPSHKITNSLSTHTHVNTKSSVIYKLHELHTTFPRAKRELRARLITEVTLNMLGCLGG